MEWRCLERRAWVGFVGLLTMTGCSFLPSRKVPPEPPYTKESGTHTLPPEVGFGSSPSPATTPSGLNFSGGSAGPYGSANGAPPYGGGMILPGSPAGVGGPAGAAR